MKKIFFILLTLLTSSAHAAEVFKCQLKSGKTVYQSTPCESSVKQKAIEIQKIDPRKVAEEEAKLKAWKEDFAKREAERIKAEKEHQAELDRKASVEALKRSAEYQQQQANEAKRQADALERQNMPSLRVPAISVSALLSGLSISSLSPIIPCLSARGASPPAFHQGKNHPKYPANPANRNNTGKNRFANPPLKNLS